MNRRSLIATAALSLTALTGCSYNQSTGTADPEKSRSIDAEISRMGEASKSDDAIAKQAEIKVDASKNSGHWTKTIRDPVHISGMHDGKPVKNACTQAVEKYKAWIPGGVDVQCVDKIKQPDLTTPLELERLKDADGYFIAAGDMMNGRMMKSSLIQILNQFRPGDVNTFEGVVTHEMGHSWSDQYLAYNDRLSIGRELTDPTFNKDGSYEYRGNYAYAPDEQWARGFSDCILKSKQQIQLNSGEPMVEEGQPLRELSCDTIKTALSHTEKSSKLPLLDIFSGKQPSKPLHGRTNFNPEDRSTW